MILTVHTGDEHVGSTVALCPPKVDLDDGGQYRASKEQRWFWDCWEQFWADTRALKKRLKAKVVYVHGGDEGEGDHHGTTQIWFNSLADQERAIEKVLQVAEPVVDEWVFIRSTEAHDGPMSCGTERRAKAWSSNHYVVQNGPLYSHWLYTAVYEGVKFQAKHAPQTKGTLPHTRNPGASRQAFLTWSNYVEDWIEPPDVAVWHHVHARAQGWHRDTFCYFCPPWQVSTAWAKGRFVSGPRFERPGGMRFACEDGGWVPHELRFKPESNVAWSTSSKSRG